MNPRNESPPDSALGLTNIHDATGLADFAEQRIWDDTVKAIESVGYELRGKLGGGATAIVHEANEKNGGRKLVVKVLADPNSEHALACFRREFKLLASEHVPTDVVPYFVYGYGIDGPAPAGVQPFLAMERIPGGQPIQKYVHGSSVMSVDDRIALAERCFLALERLHASNIVHNDISPGNVLVQPGNVVRLIDLGRAKPLVGAVGSLRSVSGPRGTPGFADRASLRGEDRSAVWHDIRAMAAVAFYTLVDETVDPKFPDDVSRANALAASGVPTEVMTILVKALRSKDPRKEIDPRLYVTAKEVAEALRAWRERRDRRAARTRQRSVALKAAVAVALPLIAVAWLGWSSYWAERRADQTREILALRTQAAGLSHADHPEVKKLSTRVDLLSRERDQALSRGQTGAADAVAPDLAQTLRQVIDLRRGLERCLPLRKALGEVLALAPWIEGSEAVAREKRALEERYTLISAKIESGDTDAAWVELGELNAALGDLAKRNASASRVAEPRARLQRAFKGLSKKLADLAAADPAFRKIENDASAAEQAWATGDWDSAERLVGLAQQALTDWLVGKETPEELTARRAADIESAAAAATREQALRNDIARLESLKKDLSGQVGGLNDQIVKLTKQNLIDRDAYVEASKELEGERTRRTAGEIKIADLTSSLDQERLASGKTTKELLAERSAKENAFQSLAKAEGEVARLRKQAESQTGDIAAKDEDLKTALADVQYWKTRATVAAGSGSAPPPPRTSSSRPIPGWVGSKPGDLKIVRFQNQEIRLRWCPAGTFTMGSPKGEADRDKDEDQVEVTFSRGAWMMETEVTQGLWQAVMGQKLAWEGKYGLGPNYPVYYVSHTEAVAFAAKLTDQLRALNLLPAGLRLGLPTEARWEQAARAGTKGRFPFDGGDAALEKFAWYYGNAKGTTHEVGTREPNDWGIRDMLGNCYEWTADGYSDKLPGGRDPVGPAAGASYRVFRGGCWSSRAWNCRPAGRDGNEPEYRNDYLGFRLAADQE